jgi:hypothetical protein
MQVLERVLDVREAYHLRPGDLEGATHAPLGLLLADPARLPRGTCWRVRAHDAREAEFVARILRDAGHAARADTK